MRFRVAKAAHLAPCALRKVVEQKAPRRARTEILRFDEEGIEEVAYEETEAFQTMDLFIRDREGLLRRLLAEE